MCLCITHIFVMTVRVYEGVSLSSMCVYLCLCVLEGVTYECVQLCTDIVVLINVYECMCVCVCVCASVPVWRKNVSFPFSICVLVCIGGRGLCSGISPHLYPVPLSPSLSLYNPCSSSLSFQEA
jgi:hypothetical protein